MTNTAAARAGAGMAGGFRRGARAAEATRIAGRQIPGSQTTVETPGRMGKMARAGQVGGT